MLNATFNATVRKQFILWLCLSFAGSKIDTNTFTRPKKKPLKAVDNQNGNSGRSSSCEILSPADSGCQDVVPERINNIRNNLDVEESLKGAFDRNANGHNDRGSQENLLGEHKLEDVMDVQVVARMQEEST